MIFFFVLALIFAPTPGWASENEGCNLALVEESAGNSVVIASDGTGTPLGEGQSLKPGDLLKTGNSAWVELRLCDGSGLRVGENTEFYYEGNAGEGESLFSWAFRLATGSIFANVAGDGKNERVKLRIRTPSAALGVRGTEFVVDADSGRETVLHTMEGEVLMGHADDFDKLGLLHGKELHSHFEPVAREQMSRLKRGERRPVVAAFKMREFRAKRGNFLGRPLRKKGIPEIRARFQGAHKLWREERQKRSLFDRSREKIEKRIEKSNERLNGGKKSFRKRLEERPRVRPVPSQRSGRPKGRH